MIEIARDVIQRLFKDLVFEEDGMEMVEWSIVGVVFALAGAILWTTLNQDVSAAMTRLGNCIQGGDCGGPAQ
jgi:Flp pilus assembly pilin Flp